MPKLCVIEVIHFSLCIYECITLPCDYLRCVTMMSVCIYIDGPSVCDNSILDSIFEVMLSQFGGNIYSLGAGIS